MSQENVEIVRVIFEDFLARRRGDVERIDSEIEWDATESRMPDIGGVYRGREGVRRFWREWLAAWETVEFDYELIDAGDRVVALIDQRMRARSTGMNVPMGKYAQVWTFREGRVVHWKLHLSQADALEAVGLSE